MPPSPSVICRVEVADGPPYSRVPRSKVRVLVGRLAILSTRKVAPSTARTAELDAPVCKRVPPPVRRKLPETRVKPLVQVTPGLTVRSIEPPVSLVRREPAATPLPVHVLLARMVTPAPAPVRRR